MNANPLPRWRGFNLLDYFASDIPRTPFPDWEMWAKRYRAIPVKMLSFDLINEPAYIDDMNDQFAAKTRVPDDVYRQLAERAAKVIRKHNPDRMIVADGNSIGNDVVLGISDLNILRIWTTCRWPAFGCTNEMNQDTIGGSTAGEML